MITKLIFIVAIVLVAAALLPFFWKINVISSRWPWQKFDAVAPLNPMGSRFGGGWHYALGFKMSRPTTSGFTIILDLMFGSVRLEFRSHAAARKDKQAREDLARLRERMNRDYQKVAAEDAPKNPANWKSHIHRRIK